MNDGTFEVAAKTNYLEMRLPSAIEYIAHWVDFDAYERMPDESRERLCNKMAREICDQRENRYLTFNEARVITARALTEISENRDKYADMCEAGARDRARHCAIAIKQR